MWNKSYLRGYLKEKFEEYFSDEEKDAIIEKEFGKLFVLSENEMLKYYPIAEDRRAVMHSVFNDKEEVIISIEHQKYWLRKDADSGEMYDVPMVTALGEIEYDSPEHDEIGIRPAMWIDIKKARLLTAKKGYNKWHHFWKIEEF